MLRTSLITVSACLVLLNEPLCAFGDDGPCVYEETPLETDDVTLWDTTVAEDIAALEIPQPGTWTWSASIDELDIDDAQAEFPAIATFVHDPAGVRLQEHTSGGKSVACDPPTVLVDGTLTFTNEQNEVIVSVPITAQRSAASTPQYGSGPLYSPISVFSTGLHTKVEFAVKQITGRINWVDNKRLVAEFFYHAQSMTSSSTGDGVFSQVAQFEADEVP